MILLAEALGWALVTERVQVFRGGQARTYVLAEEHEDGSLLLAPEPVTGAQDTHGPLLLQRADSGTRAFSIVEALGGACP